MGINGAQPEVCCVILNWNGRRDTLDCLDSLRRQDYGNLEIIVVDNGSTDDSREKIRSAFPEVTLIETGANLGYSKGCNVGLRAALDRNAELLWLLNNDTVCPPDTLTKLVKSAIADPQVGLVGTVLYYAHDPTKIQAWGGGRIQRWLGISRHFYAPTKFDRNTYLTFASVLGRRAMFEEVGLLYEGFFMYYDDVDLCLRLQKTDWKLAMAEDTAVLHKEGGSTPKGESLFMTKTVTVSGLRFISRNSGVALVGMPMYVILRLGNRIVHGRWRAAWAVWQGAMEFLRKPML